jgi:cell division septal protein FtsQ
MPSPKRNKVIDLKKAAEKREETRWAAPPRAEAARSSKPQRLRSRRRKQKALMFSVCLLLGAGFAGGLGFVSHLERLAIKDVSVTGAEQLSANALTAAVRSGLTDNRWWIFAKQNIFLYPQSEIEAKLSSEFPRIKDVELKRPSLLAQAVVVTVEERKPYAKWCAEKCFFLDESGFIFAEASDSLTPSTSYVFHDGLLPETDIIGQTFLRGRLPEIVHFLELLKAAGYEPRGISVENEKDFSVSLADAFILRVLFDAEGEKVIHDLKLALEADSVRDRVTELEYVDMRFGNRVYYKFKGEAPPAEE